MFKLHMIVALIFVLDLSASGKVYATQSEKDEEKNLGYLYQEHMPGDHAQTKTHQEVEPNEEKISCLPYSGPQWGLNIEEIDYLFKNSNDLVCIFEVGCKFQRLNLVWHETLGWETQELLDTPYISFVHPSDVERTLDYEKSFPPSGLINRYRCKDGTYRWLDWIGLSMLREPRRIDRKGFPLAIARDITLTKVLEDLFFDNISLLEEKQRVKSFVLERIAEIQNSHMSIIKSFISAGILDKKHAFKTLIRPLITLSESDVGFFGEAIFSEEQDDKTKIKYTWDSRSNLFETIEIDREKKLKLEKVFDSLIKDKKLINQPLIISNIIDYSNTFEIISDIYPLKSFLGIPLMEGDKLVGLIGLSSCREEGYQKHLIDFMEPIISISSNIIHEIKLLKKAQKYIKSNELARKKAEEENVIKSNFLAHMSHELRTPLTGLLGMIDLINKKNLHENDLKYLETARESGMTLLNIVNDILDLSKIESGQLKFESVEFSPAKIVQEVFNLLEPEAKKKNIDLNIKIIPEIPHYLIGDPTRLLQIFFNLIGNAIKFTPKGVISVFCDGFPIPQRNQFCLVCDVIDNGIGISPESQKNLFQPFMQSDSSIYRKFGGTGLGLYISKKLCEMMEGQISVSSEIGKGSKFHFEVYLKLIQEPSSFQSINERPIDTLPKISILVVEDNAVSQLVLKTMLTRAGCSVTTAWNGEEALQFCQTNHYDVVLMDCEMPVMDGLEATRKIRETFDRETLPIIGVTAHAMITEKSRFLKAGMNGYLTKPIQKDILFREIMNFLPEQIRE